MLVVRLVLRFRITLLIIRASYSSVLFFWRNPNCCEINIWFVSDSGLFYKNDFFQYLIHGSVSETGPYLLTSLADFEVFLGGITGTCFQTFGKYWALIATLKMYVSWTIPFLEDFFSGPHCVFHPILVLCMACFSYGIKDFSRRNKFRWWGRKIGQLSSMFLNWLHSNTVFASDLLIVRFSLKKFARAFHLSCICVEL